jgi:hypothetical protein
MNAEKPSLTIALKTLWGAAEKEFRKSEASSAELLRVLFAAGERSVPSEFLTRVRRASSE